MATPVSKFKQRAEYQNHSDMKLDFGGGSRRLAPDSFDLNQPSAKSRQPTHLRSQSQKAESEVFLTPNSTSLSKQKVKLNNLLKRNGGKDQEIKHVKGKYSLELPVLKKKKLKVKRLKEKRASLPSTVPDANDLYLQLNMQADPLLQGAYPTSLLSSYQVSPVSLPFNFKFDTSINRNPILVFPETRNDQL